jgi:hypothetical protein
MKTSSKVLLAVVSSLLISTPAYAFHSGGVAECEGCHSMHNSYEGSSNVTGIPQYQSGPYLLKAQDQSGTCLNCHQADDTVPTGYHVSTAGVTSGSDTPVEMTPGGDFSWLKVNIRCEVRPHQMCFDIGGLNDRHGHNIIAVDYGYTQDNLLTTAPGGTYPAANLACSSCHDPHGRYRRFADGSISTTGLPTFGSGSYTSSSAPIAGVSAVGVYRLLAGEGYQPKSLSGSYAFSNAPPAAVAPSSYNGVNTTIDGTFDRVAYGSNMSEWCANCHSAMHIDTYTSGTKGLVHPAGNGAKFTAAVANNYAAYVSSGIMTGSGVGYSSVAPFETGNGQTIAGYTSLKAFQTNPNAPTTSNNVFCLSCHRAHASAFDSATRFYLGNEFMTVADSSNAAMYDSSATDFRINRGYDVSQQTAAYNGRPATLFGPKARNYCNKCHAKD